MRTSFDNVTSSLFALLRRSNWHLRRFLPKYANYCNELRTHFSLGKEAPCTRPTERFGEVIAHPILGGLHHRCARAVQTLRSTCTTRLVVTRSSCEEFKMSG